MAGSRSHPLAVLKQGEHASVLNSHPTSPSGLFQGLLSRVLVLFVFLRSLLGLRRTRRKKCL